MKRNEQREQAFILLFEYLFLPQDDLVAIYGENTGTVSDYAKELYTGVLANLDKLDETLASYSKKWKLNRLPQGEPDCAAPGALRNGVCGRSAGQRGDQ
mgnify:CR=1 FL=1